MRTKTIFAAAAVAAFLAPATAGAESPLPSLPVEAAEASVPFANRRIRSFRSLDPHSVYLRVSANRWYLARTATFCRELPYAIGIGVDTVGSTLDRFSTLIVAGERCPLTSLVRSGPPPKKVKMNRART